MFRTAFLAGALGLVACTSAHSQTAQINEDENRTESEQTWSIERIEIKGTMSKPYGADDASVTRVPIPLIETPQSIQVLTPTLLSEQEVNTLSDALLNVSGVIPSAPSEMVLANPAVRGFEAEIYVDGLIGYGDTAVIDPASLIGVERVEVAKGPSSVLFGGGSGAPVGGLINVVTKTPTAEAFTRVGLRTGSFQTFTPNVDINLPIGDRAGFRLPAEYHKSNDYIDDVEIERLTLNPSFSFALSDQTELLLRAGYNRIEQLEYAGLPAEVADRDDVDRFQFPGATDTPDTEIENLSLHSTLTHRFSDNLEGTLQLRRFSNRFDEFATTPFFEFFPVEGTSAPIIRGILPVDTLQWTLDASLTATFETGRVEHTLLGGITYDDTNYEGATGFDLVPIGIYDYVSETPELVFGDAPALDTFLESDYKTLAGYVQNHMRINDRLNLLIGARLSHYELTEIEGGQGTDENFTRFDPRIGATFEFSEGFSAFAGWSTGSRLSLFFVAEDEEPPELETSESFEVGLKFNLDRIGLSGTIAAFNITRDNVPTDDPVNFLKSIQTGEQESEGFEIDLVWEPTRQLSVLLSAAFTDAEVTQDTEIPVGDGIPRIPEYSGRLAARYRFDGALSGLGIGAGFTWSSEAEITLPNSFQSDNYGVFDLQASYAFDRYRIGLTIQNLLDADYFTPYQYFSQAVVRPGAPRSAFITLGAEF